MRLLSFVTATTLGGLVASATAVADPQRAPAHPTSPTAIPNPQRDPVPPAPVCRNMSTLGGYSDCEQRCEGLSAVLQKIPRDTQACDEVGRNNASGIQFLPNPKSPPNLAEAFRLYGLSCNPLPGNAYIVGVSPFWGGCYDLGTANLKGEGTAKNEPVARELFGRACGLAAPGVTYEACFAAGQMYEVGTAGPKDIGAALDAYKKACDAGYHRACQAFLRIQPATQTPSHTPPGTSPSSIPAPPRVPAPRGAPAPRQRVQ